MARSLLSVAFAAYVAAAAMIRDQPNLLMESRASCEQDDLAMAKLTMRTCQINWALDGDPKHKDMWASTAKVGCWTLLAYNTDKFFSSTVYQRGTDGRCALVFSGYHGALAGYARGMVSLQWPPTTWNMCGYQMYAPYVRLFQHHSSLGNWSMLMHKLAGPNSTCKGDPIFAAESMGGSTGEMLAACGNTGRLDELLPKGLQGLPGFHLQDLYTFGSPAATTVPITNTLRPDGCFRGKRIFFSGDAIAHFGTLHHLQHPRMDAVQIWPSEKGLDGKLTKPSAQAYPCESREAVADMHKEKPPPPRVKQEFQGERDPMQHSVTSYEADMQWFHNVGLGDLFSSEPNTVDRRFMENNDMEGREEEQLMQTSAARYASAHADLKPQRKMMRWGAH